tara:strand:+ start:530 stop:1018 length:489 start_codon:yes stop_codon:yes gene_type:complete
MAEPLLDAPIPGQSLTAPLGGRPWQSPPQFSTVDEATDFYISRMSTPEFSSQLAEVLEMGVPATTIANTLQMGNVMEGKHTIDVGMLVLPLIVEMIMFIAESEGIDYDDGLTEVRDNKTNDAVLENIRRKMKEQAGKKEEPTAEVEEIVEEDMPTGLMARRT